MPVLQNPRHEAFAQALAKGKSADEAYAQAGYRPSRHNASRLTTNDNVRKRVTELQARAADKAEWSAADRLKGLKTIYDATLEKDPRVAISAIAEANKMQGTLAAQKHQHAGTIGTYDLSKMSDDEFDRLEAILGRLADTGPDEGGEASANS
jgi:phage terminase small subunit